MRSPLLFKGIPLFILLGGLAVLAYMPVEAASPARNRDPVIVGAGDIAAAGGAQKQTAGLISGINPTAVFTLGDNAYDSGTLSEYRSHYDPSWGRFNSIVRPVPGNHDYHTPGASGYFAYFGRRAPADYYSYDIGAWHLIALNGEIDVSADSAQEQWLRRDLTAHSNTCTLAYWHEPRFSSGSHHGSDPSFAPFWLDLYAAGADVVLNGHEHNYERFAKQTPSAQPAANGIREFVVGTGGRSHYGFGVPVANSELRNATAYGVLSLTLHARSYDWRFTSVGGFSDSGADTCNTSRLPPPARCRVPGVIGKKLQAARSLIRKRNCRVGMIRRARSRRVGRVLAQDPRAGKVRPARTRVNLVVGRSPF